jgi:pimeloyl-ACP methyl ester carboxylesterase
MKLIDVGSGTPVVLVPGIQGRWEWMKPAVDALARQCRVITFSLADEPTCGGRFDASSGFWCYVDQIADAMNAAGVSKAVICGVSYGGLIAAAFTLRHPQRVSALVLASALPPTWIPDSRVRFYLRAPRLLTPLFVVGSVRMYREIAAATAGFMSGLFAAGRHGLTALTYMFSPVRMARRVELIDGIALQDDLRHVHVPTLVVTGEAGLDRVVPVEATREYSRMWPHALQVTLPRTGHLGLITRPDEFTRIVTSFIRSASEGTAAAAGDSPAVDHHRRRVV